MRALWLGFFMRYECIIIIMRVDGKAAAREVYKSHCKL